MEDDELIDTQQELLLQRFEHAKPPVGAGIAAATGRSGKSSLASILDPIDAQKEKNAQLNMQLIMAKSE